ncbi:MAG: aminopeptidase, partial [Gemmatimonadetes bacterium]|nr:aminopeptidase [Gemmatimonadota bacterium]
MIAPVAFLLAFASDTLAGPGISRALAERRANDVSDVRYALRLDVTARDTATGHADLRFRRRGTGDLVLDFRGPSFDHVVVNGRAVAPRVVNGHLILPADALRRGANDVSIDFRALIAPAGASIIRFHDAVDSADYLYTLLVPADANQLFPCFDQPDLK